MAGWPHFLLAVAEHGTKESVGGIIGHRTRNQYVDGFQMQSLIIHKLDLNNITKCLL